MISLYKQDGEVLYGIKEFLLDSKDDLKDLPTNLRSGSSAFIIPTGEVYFLNGSKKWVPVGSSSSNSGDSTTNCSCEEVLNQLDSDKDGIIDLSENADTINMYDL